MSVTADACIILAKLVCLTLTASSKPLPVPDIFQKMLDIEKHEYDKENERSILNVMERYESQSGNDLANLRQLFVSDKPCSIRIAYTVIAEIVLELLGMSEISVLESGKSISEENRKILELKLKSLQDGKVNFKYALAVGDNEDDVKLVTLSEGDDIESESCNMQKKRARSPSSAQNQLVPAEKKGKLKSKVVVELLGDSSSDDSSSDE
eukprot:scaffold34877_cov39-Cyclotella_meneghiniana.AAC.3